MSRKEKEKKKEWEERLRNREGRKEGKRIVDEEREGKRMKWKETTTKERPDDKGKEERDDGVGIR